MSITKTQVNKITSYLSKAKGRGSTARPSLGYANTEIIEDKAYTVFTDSFSAFFFNEAIDGVPHFRERECQTWEYPSLARLVPPHTEKKIAVPTLEELKAYIKKTPKENGIVLIKCQSTNSTDSVWLDANRLKNVFEILGVKELEASLSDYFKPLRLEVKGSDNFAILAQVRKYKEE